MDAVSTSELDHGLPGPVLLSELSGFVSGETALNLAWPTRPRGLSSGTQVD